jgi:hypothetical protein
MDISTIEVDQSKAMNFGGMMYVDNPNQGVQAQDVIVTNAEGTS